jgi:hypothetical protein
MANPEHLAILKQGVEIWNKWKTDHPEIKTDLSHVDLSKKDLSGINFFLPTFQVVTSQSRTLVVLAFFRPIFMGQT